MKRYGWGFVRRVRRLGLALLIAATTPAAAHVAAHAGDVPFGDRVSPAVSYYHRATPHISTGGVLGPNGAAELGALGYRTVIDLRTPKEGTAAERAAVEQLGLRYVNIPIAKGAPTKAQVAEFTALLSDAGNRPIHVHCASGNRVGAMWALYLAAGGMPPGYALEAGRTAGLRGKREARVRQMLGLPPG